MGYCTQDDLLLALPEESLIQLTDDANVGIIDADRTAEAIDTAGAEIDGWCGGRYLVPFSPVPALIRKFAVDLAIYNLYARRTEVVPELREKRYRDAMRLLEKISTGAIELGSAAANVAPAASGASFESDPRRFRRDVGWP
jgi:phage gp36-like protein